MNCWTGVYNTACLNTQFWLVHKQPKGISDSHMTAQWTLQVHNLMAIYIYRCVHFLRSFNKFILTTVTYNNENKQLQHSRLQQCDKWNVKRQRFSKPDIPYVWWMWRLIHPEMTEARQDGAQAPRHVELISLKWPPCHWGFIATNSEPSSVMRSPS